MKIHTLFGAAFVFVASCQRPDIYLIRHGEKNTDGTISTKGMARARCLETVFRKDSGYNIQKMMAQKVWSGQSRLDHLSQRPYNTTLPLAQSLNQTIETNCEFFDIFCAADEARQYDGPGNVLVAWEHITLSFVAAALSGDYKPYPGDHYDLIYKLEHPYNEISISSQDCPGIDFV